MKQSSVQFAVEKLEALIPSGNQLAIYAILEQAKAMHKQEIEDAYSTAQREMVKIVEEGFGLEHDESMDVDNEDAEQYYKEKFA